MKASEHREALSKAFSKKSEILANKAKNPDYYKEAQLKHIYGEKYNLYKIGVR